MAKVLGVLVAALLAWGSAAQADEHARWQRLENNPSCVVWNAYPQPNDTVTWSGTCASGKTQGRGTQVWRYLEYGEWTTDEYEGDYRDGKEHGRGVYVWANGSRYEGDWKDGKAHGRGTIWVRDGRSFKGYWTNGCFKQGEAKAWIGTSKEACGFD